MWLSNKRHIASLQQENERLRKELAQSLAVVELVERRDFTHATTDVDVHESVILQKLHKLRADLAAYHEAEVENKWVSTGLTRIGFLFEDGSKDVNSVLDTILRDLVRYTEANQGALYLLAKDEEENPYLDMASVYAYGKKKHLNKRVGTDEGLVGQAFLEGSYIYMTDVPKSYVKITSGLGEATPRCIFIIPLKTRTHTIGVLEMAFFQHLKPFQIGFLEKISENLANAIFLVQSANNNVKLLEHAQTITDQLKEKERELMERVNELTEIQDNLNYKNSELEHARLEIEHKKNELEQRKEEEYELIQSKLRTQQAIHDVTIRRLTSRIADLEKQLTENIHLTTN